VSVLLYGILLEATGQTADRYAEQHLFAPLGIDEYHWKKTPLGLPDTEGGLYLEPEDLAKLGYLFLHDGMWEGERLLPEGWVEASVHPWVEDIDPDNGRIDPGYGYQWWVFGDDEVERPLVYAARGYGGQLLFVAPELDLITVFTGWNIFDGQPASTTELFFDRILPAAKGDTAGS
jgi:CubicO group peptidase (beta-lactamase class C family)